MTPHDRIIQYFAMCSQGTARDIASHFTVDAVIFDTNVRPIHGAEAIGAMWVKVRERWGGARWSVDSCIADGCERSDRVVDDWNRPEDQRTFHLSRV